MVHCACIAHAQHRVAEKIREQFNKVDGLISNVKKVFLKAPTWVEIFKNKLPNIPLLPAPVITRWGTWLESAVYYANNLAKIRDVFSKTKMMPFQFQAA